MEEQAGNWKYAAGWESLLVWGFVCVCFEWGICEKGRICAKNGNLGDLAVDIRGWAGDNAADEPKWRNWQTRGIQNPVLATG